MKNTLRSWSFFKSSVLRQDVTLRRYSLRKRGRELIEPNLFADLVDRRTGHLYCANANARIYFARATERMIRQVLRPSRARQAYFVSLAVDTDCMPFEEAVNYDWSALQIATVDLFAGYSFWGAVEAAYFSVHPTSQTAGAFVSFHTHSLVWDIRRDEIDAICDAINLRQRSLLPGRPVAHRHPINDIGVAVSLARYAVKPSLRNYRAYPLRGEDGRLTADWTSREWDLYPRDAARMARLFMGVEIDALCFEGGAASGFTKRIGESARIQIARHERRELRRVVRDIQDH